MKTPRIPLLIITALIMLLSTGGVFATWQYTITNVPTYEDYDFGGIGMTDYEWMAPSTANTVVYITNISKKSGNGSLIVNGYKGTYANTTKTLVNNSASSITLTITVYNSSTTDDYAFSAVKYTSDQYDNPEIGYTLVNLERGDRVAKGEYLSFDVTFAFVSGAGRSKLTLNSILNYEFTIAEELPDEGVIAVSGALAQFNAILNNVVAKDSYKQLTDQMDKYGTNDRHDDSYIGNVNGASELDVELLAELFEGNLKLNINGKEEKVTAIIKRENLDGNVNTGDADGNEMTIYLTTDGLTKGIFEFNKSAVVYAAIFTSTDDGTTWSQLGDMYEGTATIKGYDGNVFGSGSFDTDSWKTKNNAGISNNLTIEQLLNIIR